MGKHTYPLSLTRNKAKQKTKDQLYFTLYHLAYQEVALLTDLYNCFNHDNNLIQYLQARSQQKLAYLHIIVTSNMGPCIRCQARIEALLQDLQAYAQKWNCQILLRLDMHYTTQYNEVNREAYGYDPKKYTVTQKMFGGEQPGYESWPYWSVSLERPLI